MPALLAIGGVAWTVLAAAQEPPEKPRTRIVTVDRVFLKNGNWVDGKIIGRNAEELLIEVKGILVGIRHELVRDRKKVDLRVRVREEKPPGPKEGGGTGEGPEKGAVKPPEGGVNIEFPEISEETVRNVDSLLRQLSRGREADRAFVLEQLAKLGEEAQIYLVQMLPRFETEASLILEAILRIQSGKGLPYLVRQLPNLNDRTKAMAFAVLARKGYVDAVETIAGYLQYGKGEDLKAAAATALGELGARRYLDLMLDALRGAGKNLAGRVIGAVRSWAKQDPQIVDRVRPSVLDLLKDRVPATRVNGAVLAGALKIAEAGPSLVRMLDAEDPPSRAVAAEAIAEIGYQAGWQNLADRLGDEPETEVRRAYVEAIGRLLQGSRNLEPVPILVSLLEDPIPSIRSAAADALAAISGENFGTDRYRWLEWYRQHVGGRE